MQVLVSGASGLLGSALCDALLARGDEVAGLSREPNRARRTNPTVRWHAWEPLSERPPAEAVDGVDAVVNLIGESIDQRWTDQAKHRIRATRIDATRNLIQGIAASQARPQTFVSQSAIGYYGDHGEALVDESVEPGDRFDSKLVVDWESAAAEASELGMRLAITRTSPVLSKDGGLLKALLTPFRLGVGGPMAGGDQYTPWIHIDDLVALYLWALDTSAVSGVLNATSPEPVTNREFSKALGRALRRPAVMPLPRLALNLRLGSELAEAAVASIRAVPRRPLDLGFTFRYAEIDGAMKAAVG
jgi:uncharacterized protein